MGDKDETCAVGTELQRVQLSAAEIWKIMAPTDPRLQLRVIISLVLLVLCRLANIMVPLTFKQAIDILTQIQTGASGAAAAAALTANTVLLHAAMSTVAMFFVWKLTQGLGEIARQYLWVAVQSDLKRRISEQLLGHLHSLSFRFHVSSKSGQVLGYRHVLIRGRDVSLFAARDWRVPDFVLLMFALRVSYACISARADAPNHG